MLHTISFTVAMIGAASFVLCWLVGVYSIFRRIFADPDERPHFLRRFYMAFAAWLVATIGALGLHAFE